MSLQILKTRAFKPRSIKHIFRWKKVNIKDGKHNLKRKDRTFKMKCC